MRQSSINKQMLRTWLVIGCLPLLTTTLTGCQKTASPSTGKQATATRRIEVTVAEAVRTNIATPVEFVGNLLPRRRTLLVAEVDGVIRSIATGTTIDVVVEGKRYVENLGIAPGEFVRKGQVLVELDPTDYELALATARSKLARSQAELKKLLAGLRAEEIANLQAVCDEASARLKLAEAEFERTKQLSEKNVVTQSEYDNCATTMETSRATLASAQAALDAAKAGPTDEEVAVAKTAIAQEEAQVRIAEENLSKTSIRAPYDGVVTDIYVDEGDRVSAAGGSNLLEMMDLRYLIAEIGVPEKYLGKIHVKDQAKLSLAGRKDTIQAIVIAINGKVDYESRMFRVRVAIDNNSGFFKAGQFALVHFSLSGSPYATVVPSRAVIFKEGQPQVYVCRNDRVERRSVVLGVESADHTEIVSGLNPGERVVVDDPSLLTNGMVVSVRAVASSLAARKPMMERGVQ